MDSFFTQTFTLKAISDAWSDRKRELRKLQQKLAVDELLIRLKNRCVANRAQLHEELVDAALNAMSPSQLRIPIWSYKAVVFPHWVENHAEQLQYAQAIEADETFRVNGRTERVHTIVRQTDFLVRLAAFFGPAFRVRVLKEPVVERQMDDWQCHTWTLVIEYFPRTATVTPPPASPLSEPPPVVRTGSVHAHEDADSLRQAAREMTARIVYEEPRQPGIRWQTEDGRIACIPLSPSCYCRSEDD